jgi:hypothetical protein
MEKDTFKIYDPKEIKTVEDALAYARSLTSGVQF